MPRRSKTPQAQLEDLERDQLNAAAALDAINTRLSALARREVDLPREMQAAYAAGDDQRARALRDELAALPADKAAAQAAKDAAWRRERDLDQEVHRLIAAHADVFGADADALTDQALDDRAHLAQAWQTAAASHAAALAAHSRVATALRVTEGAQFKSQLPSPFVENSGGLRAVIEAPPPRVWPAFVDEVEGRRIADRDQADRNRITPLV